jgi:hypothetical protein
MPRENAGVLAKAPTSEVTVMVESNTELAERLGVTPPQLRRELLFVEAAGLARFRRIGKARVVAADQVETVRAWLERRGLLKDSAATVAG